MALLLVVAVAELVFGFFQLPLQTLGPSLLLLRLALCLLLKPLRHPACHTTRSYSRSLSAGGAAALLLLLFLVIDVSQAPPAQVSARLTVGRLLDLSAESSQHGAEP